MTERAGTCVTVDDDYTARCECGRTWRLGDAKAFCVRCVMAKCEHPKAGVDTEQGRLL